MPKKPTPEVEEEVLVVEDFPGLAEAIPKLKALDMQVQLNRRIVAMLIDRQRYQALTQAAENAQETVKAVEQTQVPIKASVSINDPLLRALLQGGKNK